VVWWNIYIAHRIEVEEHLHRRKMHSMLPIAGVIILEQEMPFLIATRVPPPPPDLSLVSSDLSSLKTV